MKDYPNLDEYAEDAICLMQGDERHNEYWIDLCNMLDCNKDGMGVVVFDVLRNEQDAQCAVDYFRDLFKPRYNILDNKCKCNCEKNIRF